MRRVLMTADTVGGVWTYALDLARALRPCGVEIVLATMGAPLTAEQWRNAEGIDVYQSRYKLEWMDDPWRDVAAAGDWLLDLEQRLRPDLIHLNGYAHAALAWCTPVLVVAHSCVLSWWQAVKAEDAPPEWRRYREAVAGGVRAAGLVVAPSRTMMAEVNRFYGPLARAVVIPNGRAARTAEQPPKEPIVFAAGRLWDEGKNLAALDRAAEGLPWPVYVAGETLHPDGTDRGGRHVRALGRLDPSSVSRWMARAGVYAHPARYEPFGLSVLEAAGAGCALVLGDIPSLRENWEGCAEFVDPVDWRELHACLRRLTCDFTRRGRLAEAAKRRAAVFTPERMAEAYLAAYGVLMSAGRLHKHAGSSRH